MDHTKFFRVAIKTHQSSITLGIVAWSKQVKLLHMIHIYMWSIWQHSDITGIEVLIPSLSSQVTVKIMNETGKIWVGKYISQCKYPDNFMCRGRHFMFPWSNSQTRISDERFSMNLTPCNQKRLMLRRLLGPQQGSDVPIHQIVFCSVYVSKNTSLLNLKVNSVLLNKLFNVLCLSSWRTSL